MCIHCTASWDYRNVIEAWADDGLPYANIKVLARPTAIAYPNTYVFIFEDAVTMNGVVCDVFVDVHYFVGAVPPAPKLVIGGLWIRGLAGDMKPQQHGGELLRQLMAELPHNPPTGGIAGVWGDRTGTAPLPVGLSHSAGASKDLYPLSGWGNGVPPKRSW